MTTSLAKIYHWRNRIGAVVGLLLLSSAPVRAGDKFELTLALSDANRNVSTSQPSTGPATRPRAGGETRLSMESTADAPIVARWKVTAVGSEPMTDVVVHFYVVRVDRFDQAPPALEPVKVVAESAVLMDFDLRTSTHADIPFRVQSVGKYLVMIETAIKSGKDTLEQHAAMELTVK